VKVLPKLLLAEIKQFVRERSALAWTFLFPIFFILIFGAIFGGQDTTTFSIGLVMEDNSPAAQGLVTAFQQVPAFELHNDSRTVELQALENGDRSAVVVITPDFGASIAQGSQGSIDVYYDPSQTTVSQIVLPIVNRVVGEYERAAAQMPALVQVNEKTLQAYNLRMVDYMVPGILAMSLMQLGLYAAAPLVVQREKKVLKRLGATPLRRSTMVLSQVVFRLIIAVVQAALIIVVARLAFGVPMLGNWFFLGGVIILGTMTFLALGYMLSAFAKTEEAIMPLLMAISFPMMFLSGIFFPVDMMPGFMQPVMAALPLTYLGDSMRQIMVNASAIHPMLLNLAVLGAWFVACLVVAVRFFKWE
jgi:ABC-2 type transport system permease protein